VSRTRRSRKRVSAERSSADSGVAGPRKAGAAPIACRTRKASRSAAIEAGPGTSPMVIAQEHWQLTPFALEEGALQSVAKRTRPISRTVRREAAERRRRLRAPSCRH
jgi:hypothetical protein